MRYHRSARRPRVEPPAIAAATIRMLDIAICIVVAIVALPVLIGVALAIRLVDRGPILFAQRRMGLGGRSFRCLKFRTMVPDADVRLRALLAADAGARAEWAADQKLRHDPRVTAIGGLLRRFSLDELPQLFNVIRGDMSLVGPRPIVANEAARYGARYWTYCTARPGITGIWQISGRSDVRYRRRVAMDVVFARAPSLGLYMRVLAQTMPALLLRRGAY